jgi:hypothetical protein
MSLGFRDQKEARRRRWRFFRLLFFTAVLVGLGIVAYQTGTLLANREVSRLRLEVEKQSTDIAALRDENVQLRQQAEAASQAEAEWRERYEVEVPTGRTLDLLALIKEQINKGADPERIEFLVGAAANDRSCDGEPRTKRFLVRTPIYEGANDAVAFADNTVIVTAQGESATDVNGNPEAWFDVAKPVLLRFAEPGGGGTEATGLLPLHHSVVRGDKEFRFSAVAAERQGFLSVTVERCAFP